MNRPRLVRLPGRPADVEPCGKPYSSRTLAGRWQTYIPADSTDDRTYEHNETRDEWYEVHGI